MTSISCASTASVEKTPGNGENRSKSCDTVCTSNSSCFFKRRKPMNPLAYPVRPTYHKTNSNPVKQRVMSAKLLKVRQLQSQLNDANFHLAEVARENQILKTLQKRQDKALSKYENTNADLPRLIHSHEEEIRVLTDKNRNLRRNVKDLNDLLKQKEDELTKVREQLSRLEKLNKDKHLTEREKLMEKMEDLRTRLQKSEETVTTLNRKLMLESKLSKQRLNAELVKHKQCQKELFHAFEEIDRLSGLLDAKENVVRPRNPPKLNKMQNRDSVSMVTLRQYQAPNRTLSNEKLGQTPVTDVKLEPIVNGDRKSSDGSFKIPMDSIKQRLSSGSVKLPPDIVNSSEESRDNSAGSFKSSRPSSSVKLEKLPVMTKSKEPISAKLKEVRLPPAVDHKEDESSRFEKDDDAEEGEDLLDLIEKMKKEKQEQAKHLQNDVVKMSKDDSEELERMTEHLDAAIQKAAKNSEFDTKISNYCSEVLSNVKNCNKAIEKHKESLNGSKEDTDALISAFRQTEKVETKLKKSFFNMEDDIGFVHEILNEEFKFKAENKVQESDVDKNGNKKPIVNIENKKKLLATLRAIDNGDSVESLEEPKQGNIMKEIFGHVAH